MGEDYNNWTLGTTNTASDLSDYTTSVWYNGSYKSDGNGVGKLYINGEEAKINSKKEEGMRSLYKVYVVDPRKQGKLIAEATVIAENEEKALLKAGVAQSAEKAGLEIEDVDTYVDELGTFIRPRKQTQKVHVVKEDDD